MSKLGAISVIVPVHNGGRYLPSALATVQAQTCADWELIIVNDGSTDDTAAILARLAPDERRLVISQSNTGLANARNRGLSTARGAYVAFLDVDDAWDPSYLGHMCAALDANPEAVAAFAGWQYMDESGALLPQAVVLSAAQVAQLDQELSWRNAILPSALVARRAAVLQAGGFDPDLRACEDWDLWLRLKAWGPFVAVPRVLMRYRAHSNSMTENVPNIERERLKLNAKHLGPLDEPLAQWPPARRKAVGYTYFNAALGYLRQSDRTRAQEKLLQAARCWPDLLAQDEFYYELGCAFQPRGLRGTPVQLDLAAGEDLIRTTLRESLPAGEAALSGRAWTQANLVLARLARSAGQAPNARRYAWRTIRHGSPRQRWQALRTWARSFWRAAN